MKIKIVNTVLVFMLCWLTMCSKAMAQETDEAVLGDAWAAGEDLTREDALIVSARDEQCQILKMTGTIYEQKAFEALQLVNSERAAVGLEALEMDAELFEAAKQRSAECSVFYGHTRPNGLACATISEKCFGENIAASTGMRFSTAETVVSAWMNSEGHRRNILDDSYQSIGIGCFYKDGVWYWAQEFGRQQAEPANRKNDGISTYCIQALQSYAAPFLVVENFEIEKGQEVQYQVKLYNRGWSSATAYIEQSSYRWDSSNKKITVDENGIVSAVTWGEAIVSAENIGNASCILQGTVEVCTDAVIESAEGIYVQQCNREGLVAGFPVTLSKKTDVEYSWYVATDDNSWKCISDWVENEEWLSWTPEQYGAYDVAARARVAGNRESDAMQMISYEYHPAIVGKCQMPYTGEGGGFLIGIESYENPEQSYQYEMLILDCTLLAEGKDAWIYSTGRCRVAEGNALWTVWQPQYGYYWTLFRVYDDRGVLLDEACYGFENI